MQLYSNKDIKKKKSRTLTTLKCWRGCGATGTPIHCYWERKMAQPLWKTSQWFLTKLNILLPYNLAIALLGIYPNELKTYVRTKTSTWEIIIALFIIAKTWKQPRCPSEGKCINKLWYIQTMEYYSVAKRNEISSHKKAWRNLKCILLSERGQSQKAMYCMILRIWYSGKGKTIDTVKRAAVTKFLVGK